MKNRTVFLYALLLFGTFLWGGVFVGVKHGLEYLTPYELAVMRNSFAAGVFAIILLLREREATLRLLRNDWRMIALAGFFGNVANPLCLNMGETLIPAGTASVVMFLVPLFIFLFSSVLLHERVTWRRMLGLLLAFAGLFIVVRFGTGKTIDFSHVTGILIVGGAALAWALYTVLSRPLAERYPPVVVTGMAMLLGDGMLILLVGRPSLLPSLAHMPWDGWAAVAYLGLGCNVAAFSIYSLGLHYLEATRVGTLNYLVPVWGTILSWLLLGDTLTPVALLGMLVVVVGIVLVNLPSAGQPTPPGTVPLAPDGSRGTA